MTDSDANLWEGECSEATLIEQYVEKYFTPRPLWLTGPTDIRDKCIRTVFMNMTKKGFSSRGAINVLAHLTCRSSSTVRHIIWPENNDS